MDSDFLHELGRRSDDVLLAGSLEIAGRQHRDTAALVAHLAVIDDRRLYLRYHSSLFAYCREALRMSEGASYNLIEVARRVRAFPGILSMLADGSLNLTGVRILGASLTPENNIALLESARGKSKVEIQMMVATLRPAPDVPATTRKLPPPRVERPTLPPASTPSAPAAVPAAAASPSTRPAPFVKPLAPARYSYQLTIDDEARDLLRLARDMSSHAVPDRDELELLKRMLRVYLERCAREKFAATERPGRARVSSADSRYIPVDVKRKVYVRDLGRCAYCGPDGRRCGAQAFLEFHHLKPWMAGGKATVENIGLRCAVHNRYEAQLFYSRLELPPPGVASSRKPLSPPVTPSSLRPAPTDAEP
jgi:5-methylcytosine-specific restriction endonuclease McrA